MVYDVLPLSADRLHRIQHIPEALRSDEIQNASPCTPTYQYEPCCFHHRTDSEQAPLQALSYQQQLVQGKGTNQSALKDP